MSDISFPGGTNMHVDKLYSLKNSPESMNMVNKAIGEIGDNSDYVIFKSEDKLMVAVGKGDLDGFNKNVQIGIDKTVKFNFEEKQFEAIKVVNRVNTSSEYDVRNDHTAGTIAVSGVFGCLGYLAGDAMATNVLSSSSGNIGLAVGAVIGLGVSYLINYSYKNDAIKSDVQPGINYLVGQNAIIQEK